jgi:hypothetical protein
MADLDMPFKPMHWTPSPLEITHALTSEDHVKARRIADQFFGELNDSHLHQVMTHPSADVRRVFFLKKPLTESERLLGVSDSDFSIVEIAVRNTYVSTLHPPLDFQLTPVVFESYWKHAKTRLSKMSRQFPDFQLALRLLDTSAWMCRQILNSQSSLLFIQQSAFELIFQTWSLLKHNPIERVSTHSHAQILVFHARCLASHPGLEMESTILSNTTPFEKTALQSHLRTLLNLRERSELLREVSIIPSKRNAL